MSNRVWCLPAHTRTVGNLRYSESEGLGTGEAFAMAFGTEVGPGQQLLALTVLFASGTWSIGAVIYDRKRTLIGNLLVYFLPDFFFAAQ